METSEVARRKREIEGRYGQWTAHNIQLLDDLYTIAPGVAGGNEARLQQVLQIVGDVAPAPLDQLRVLDLGALEGLFAVEFALRGAKVLAIEGREANLEKIRFTKEVLGLDLLELRLEDVRGLDRERHGEFDVVLCLGLLYHLDAPDVFMLLERIRDVCRFMTVIETHIAPYPKVRRERRRQSYWGVVGTEPSIETPPLSREALWSSLGNAQSFKLTRSSLCNALADAGYSSVVECHVPTWVRADRATFVAFTRSQQRILSVSELHRMPERLRERRVPLIEVLRRQPVYALVRKLVPTPLKRYVRRLRPRLTRPRWHEE